MSIRFQRRPWQKAGAIAKYCIGPAAPMVFDGEAAGALLVCATDETMSTDKSSTIIVALLQHLRDDRIILPAPASIGRIGLAGRARSRRLTADAMIVGLGAARAGRLDELLVNDPVFQRTRIAQLRDWAEAPTASNLMVILDRLAYCAPLLPIPR